MRKRRGRRKEPVGTLYFNVPASEETFSIQTKNFVFEIYDTDHLIVDVWKPKNFIFSRRTPLSKESRAF